MLYIYNIYIYIYIYNIVYIYIYIYIYIYTFIYRIINNTVIPCEHHYWQTASLTVVRPWQLTPLQVPTF